MMPQRRSWPTVLLSAIVLVLAMVGSSTAAVLITSADIQDGTIKPADMSSAARTAIKGAPCTVPGHGNGKITMTVTTDGRVLFGCKNAFTTDNDGDDFSEAQGDCDDANDDVNPGALETFDGLDTDCDGSLAFDVPFYTGPGGTEDVGICHGGLRNETTNPPNYYVTTSPEQTPQVEVQGDELDNDCDGQTDEG